MEPNWKVAVGVTAGLLLILAGVTAWVLINRAPGPEEGADSTELWVKVGESIQAAINRASPGAVIHLVGEDGNPWRENLVINKSITLRGQGDERTSIEALVETTPVIRIGGNDDIEVKIEGIEIARGQYGIAITGSAKAMITNCTVSNHESYGVGILGTAQATITDCTSAHNVHGIWVWDSAQATIIGSTMSDNERYGMAVSGTAQATITDCTVSRNNYGVLVWGSAQATIDDSTVAENERGVYLQDSAQVTLMFNVIRDNERYGVALHEAPLFDTDDVFTGRVTGTGNISVRNAYGDYAPDELESLFTASGGELDRQVHTVSTPNRPSGSSSVERGQSLIYYTGGASCSRGHSVEYRFDWRDGTYSSWSASNSVIRSWYRAGTFSVRAQARCSVNTSVVSDWSWRLTVAVGEPSPPTVTTTPRPVTPTPRPVTPTPSEPEPTAPGAYRIADGSHLGCVDRSELERIMSYSIVHGDDAAYRSALAAALRTGACRTFSSGEQVYLMGTDLWRGYVRVRLVGDTREYWISTAALDR